MTLSDTHEPYDTHLADMSCRLADLGLNPVPLTSMALASDPSLVTTVGHVFAHHVVEAVWSAAKLKRPSIPNDLASSSVAVPAASPITLSQLLGQLPRLEIGSNSRALLHADIAAAVTSFLQQVLPSLTDIDGNTNSSTNIDGENQSLTPSPILSRINSNDDDTAISCSSVKSPQALLPSHALPLFYVVRPLVIKHMWPPSLMAPTLMNNKSDILTWVEEDMETALGHTYVAVSVQTHLLSLYGGSSELLNILVNTSDDQDLDG